MNSPAERGRGWGGGKMGKEMISGRRRAGESEKRSSER
jgi:hypothetical protein